MGTAASVKEVSGKGEATGVIPRCIKSIFATVQSVRADYDVNMKVCLSPLQMQLLFCLKALHFTVKYTAQCLVGPHAPHHMH